MSKLKTAFIALMVGVMALVSPLVAPALAGDPVIEAAKTEGIVGEQIDGFLGIVGRADPAIQRKVDEINAGRRSVYSNLAAREGQPLSVVARLTGEKLIADAARGTYILDETGVWRVKN